MKTFDEKMIDKQIVSMNAAKEFEEILTSEGIYNEETKEAIFQKIENGMCKINGKTKTIFWAIVDNGDIISINVKMNGKEEIAVIKENKQIEVDEQDFLDLFGEISLADVLKSWVMYY